MTKKENSYEGKVILSVCKSKSTTSNLNTFEEISFICVFSFVLIVSTTWTWWIVIFCIQSLLKKKSPIKNFPARITPKKKRINAKKLQRKNYSTWRAQGKYILLTWQDNKKSFSTLLLFHLCHALVLL